MGVLTEGLRDFADVVEPLTGSWSFRRLESISFLGLLSPRHWARVPPPSSLTERARCDESPAGDGSRADHAVAVTSCVLQMARGLGLGPDATRYAAAWGLLHDIATWALSHTGEAALSRATHTSSRELRRMIILGARELPEEMSLRKRLTGIGLSPEKLAALYSPQPTALIALTREAELPDFEALWTVVHSPMTPDTLDGIWRAGRALGVGVPDPGVILPSMSRSLFGGALVNGALSAPLLTFWRRKREVYDRFINARDVYFWESNCSGILEACFADISLVESMHLPEDALIRALVENEGMTPPRALRYKPPRWYFLAHHCSRRSRLGANVELRDLSSILCSVPRGYPDEEDDEDE